MTKKHFIALANAIICHNKYSADYKFTDKQIKTLCDFCKSENGRFNYDTFTGYIAGTCGPCGGTTTVRGKKPQSKYTGI